MQGAIQVLCENWSTRPSTPDKVTRRSWDVKVHVVLTAVVRLLFMFITSSRVNVTINYRLATSNSKHISISQDVFLLSVCMYVCMSKDLYPAQRKQSHRCAAVSNKQKCLQCQFETFSRQIDWAQRGRKSVPNPRSSNSETPIAECTVGMWDDEPRSDRRSKCASAGVSDEVAVVSKVCGSCVQVYSFVEVTDILRAERGRSIPLTRWLVELQVNK